MNFNAKPVPLWDFKRRAKFARQLYEGCPWPWRKPLAWVVGFLMGPLR